jgi:prevent-host-death family protein
MQTITAEEAQRRFADLLNASGQEMLEITLSGKTSAYVLSLAEFTEIMDLRRRHIAAADFVAWRQAALHSRTPEQEAQAATLTDEDVNRMVHELR